MTIRGNAAAVLVLALLLASALPSAGAMEPAVSGSDGSGEQEISLNTAVGEALGRRPSLKAFADQVESAKQRVGESRSGYFPNLSANYADTVGNSIFGYFLFPGYQFANYNLLTVGLTQTVLDFGKVHSQVRQSHHVLKSVEAQKIRTVQSVIRDVEVAYYALLTSQHRLLSSRQSVIDAQTHLYEAKARLRAGVGLRLDVTQAKVNLEEARLDLIHEETGFRKARVDLGRAIGYRTRTHFVADDVPDGPGAGSVDPDADLARDLDSHPDILADNEKVRSRKAALDAAREQNYPTITGSADYFLAQVSIPFFPGIPTTPFSSVAVGGQLTIPIFEGGLMSRQVHEAQANLRQTLHQKEDDEVRVVAEVRDAAEDVREAQERLKESRTALDNAKENDRLVEAAYRAGTAHSVDAIDAQTALRRARVNVDSARYELGSAVVRYRFALGTIAPPGKN